MQVAAIPENEAERQASLERMQLLSTPREADLDRITRVVRNHFRTEIVTITLIDGERQWFKSKCGVEGCETARDISFCGHAINQAATFIVPDARADERFFDNPLVTGDPRIRFYAGQPLTNRDGFRIGTLCIISAEPRGLSEDEIVTLQDMARLTEIALENRSLSEAQLEMLSALETAERERMLDPLTGLWNRRGLQELLDRELARAARDGLPIALGMADIDHFKRINDSFGHPVGDQAIRCIAQILMDEMRAGDAVARFGGEEFVLVFPGQDAASLPRIGDRLLAAIRAKAMVAVPDGIYKFTASLGLVAAGVEQKLDGAALIEHADQALYRAKTEGRDRFVIR